MDVDQKKCGKGKEVKQSKPDVDPGTGSETDSSLSKVTASEVEGDEDWNDAGEGVRGSQALRKRMDQAVSSYVLSLRIPTS